MRSLCAFFAHPDDETFAVGAALARYSDEGVRVSLVTATSGEAGEVGSAPVDQAGLGAWRERELGEAADILGIHEVRLLHLPDGRLAEHEDELYAGIVQALHEIRPQVVVTEDVQGITGHPDHITVTRTLTRAVEDLGEDGPLKLYENVIPASIDPGGGRSTIPDDYVTTTVDVSAWRPRFLEALAAHASQVSPELIKRFRSFPDPWLSYLVCVRTRVPIFIPEYDIFSGVKG